VSSAEGRFSTRWVDGKKPKRTTTERSPMIPTERLVVAATAKEDAAAFDEMCKRLRVLKPPARKART
jgi:hypothetical protein